VAINSTEGIRVYSLDRTLKSHHPLTDVSCSSASANCLMILFGTKSGLVCAMQINKEAIKASEVLPEAIKVHRLHAHKGSTKLVAINARGTIGMSFGYLDTCVMFYDLKEFTIYAKGNITQMQLDGIQVSSFCFDFKGDRTLMSNENDCKVTFMDYSAPSQRRMSLLDKHTNGVYIVRISSEGNSGLTADVSNRLILWNLSGVTRNPIREFNLLEAGYITDIRLTQLSRFFVVKTTKKVIIYEPK
jgi:WD40 repeat protein